MLMPVIMMTMIVLVMMIGVELIRRGLSINTDASDHDDHAGGDDDDDDDWC